MLWVDIAAVGISTFATCYSVTMKKPHFWTGFNLFCVYLNLTHSLMRLMDIYSS